MKYIAVLVIVGVLSGCSATPYKVGESVTDTRLGQKLFEIKAITNRHSATGQTSDFVIFRAAEIACKQGKKYFRSVGSDSQYLSGRRANVNTTIELTDNPKDYDAKIILEEIGRKYEITPSCSY